MKNVKIEINANLPNDYFEKKVDDEIANLFFRLGGEVLDSKEFKKIEDFIKIELDVSLPDDYSKSNIYNELIDVFLNLEGTILKPRFDAK